MKTVLLTGAGGFIGRTAIRPLLRSGYIVHAATSRQIDESDPHLFYHNVDILDARSCAQLVADLKPTHLLHFAWYVEHKEFWESPRNDDWVRASKDLLHSFVASGGQRVVMAGTCAEYDWQSGAKRFSEIGSLIDPQSLYGKAKHELHMSLMEYAERSGVSYAWGRIFFLFGPSEQPGRFVPYVIRSLLRGEEARCSSGDHVRDFMFVEDVGKAFVALLDSDVTGAVNIGTGLPTSLGEIARSIAEIVGTPELLRLGALPQSNDDPAYLVADVKRLRDEVKFDEFTGLRSALEMTIDWWRNHK